MSGFTGIQIKDYLKPIDIWYVKIKERNSGWEVRSYVSYWKFEVQIVGKYKKFSVAYPGF